MKNYKWYAFRPSDTLFFKGAAPMVMGENHHASLCFPPPISTFAGALRTAIIMQNNIDIQNYYSSKLDQKFMDVLGPSDGEPGFNLLGPFIRHKDILYVPAPYSWFVSSKMDTIKAKLLTSPLFRIKNNQKVCFADLDDQEGEALGGKWIPYNNLIKGKVDKLLSSSDFFEVEQRVGIKLQNDSRKVEEHHLYSFPHARLKPDYRLVFAVDKDLPLSERGPLSLGGEQRFGQYLLLKSPEIPISQGRYFMALTSIPASLVKSEDEVVATGKAIYIGGWDMKKGFHKPLVPYYPAGTVFTKNINNSCIAIEE